MNTIQALQALYLKLGGSLADTYNDIAGGVAVGEYVLIPDMIAACAKIAESGTLPVANSTTLGGVKTGAKASGDTQEVHVDGNGGLWTEPGGGGAFVINVESNTMDKTWQEIYDAVDAGNVCAVKVESVEGQADVQYVSSLFSVGGTYTVVCLGTALGQPAGVEYTASSASGYPTAGD